MSTEAIGGHKGITVFRMPEGIQKVATTDETWEALQRETQWLSAMQGEHAPRLIRLSGTGRWTIQEDLGDALSIDPSPVVALGAERFFNECVDLLWALQHLDLNHGDLTPPNLAWVEGRGLCALDFQDSTVIGSDEPTKRDTTDAWQLLDTYFGLLGGCEKVKLAGAMP